jgi:hypothetical protein
MVDTMYDDERGQTMRTRIDAGDEKCPCCKAGMHMDETVRCACCGHVVHAYGCVASGGLCTDCQEMVAKAVDAEIGHRDRFYWEGWC